jgi:GNAT superfamily N-acetyltransferase
MNKLNAASIRRATRGDVDVLVGLYREFHEFHVKGVPDRLKSPDEYDTDDLRSKLVDIMEAEDSSIFVAELDGQVIGLAEVYIKEDESNPYRVSYKYAHLQSIMVSERYRRRDIGRQLLRTVEKWSKEKGGAEVRLNIWEFNSGPLRFYEKEGYRTLRRTMVRQPLQEDFTI